MNNIQSMRKSLEAMCGEVKQHAGELNGALKKLKLRQVDVSHAITNIEKQVKSAGSKFTIAFVGTFKTGKSTIINSLLGLKGDARLSSEYDPDTAKSIRIIFAEGNAGEAEVDFGGAYPVEKMPWKEAVRYTSQVALEQADDAFRKKAGHIDEVRYYVDSPLLKSCNILDLPGTGTGAHSDHTVITDEKILESDCFFWVVTTATEPDVETVRNLQKIRHKILPIINVWQKECKGIKSAMSPEKVIEAIRDNYSAYLGNADDPVVYYAGEIDNAQEKGEEVKPEWGREKLVAKVEGILSNIRSGDRAGRIESNLTDAIEECRQALEALEGDETLLSLGQANRIEQADVKNLYVRLRQCKKMAKTDINNEAHKTAEEIAQMLIDATESFITDKMDGLNFKALFKKKDKLSDELAQEYRKDYIRMDSGWVRDLADDYLDNVQTITEGIFVEFAMDVEASADASGISGKMLDIGNFTGRISEGIRKDMLDKMLPLILRIIGQGILVFIPGLNLVDAVYTIVAATGSVRDITNMDKLHAKAKAVKNSCRVQIKQQKFPIITELRKAGEGIVEQYYTQIEKEISTRGNALDEQARQYNAIVEEISLFRMELDNQEKIIRELFA